MSDNNTFTTMLRNAPRTWLAVALVMLLAGAALAREAYQEPRVAHERFERVSWTERAAFTYAVPVTHNDTLWPEGTFLPMGEPSYFRSVSSRAHVEFTWQADAPHAVEGLAQANLTLRVRGETREGVPHWELAFPLANTTWFDAALGVTLNGTIEIAQLAPRVDDVNARLPAEGRVNWSVDAVVAYALRAGDREDTEVETYRLPVGVGDLRFVMPPPEELEWEAPHGTSHVASRTYRAGPEGVLSSLRTMALLIGGAVLAAATITARLADPARGLPARDAAYARELARYAAWITTSPSGVDLRLLPRSLVDVPTVEDVVRAATDARGRVVHDPRTRLFYAILPHVTYRCARHALALPRRSPAVTRLLRSLRP